MIKYNLSTENIDVISNELSIALERKGMDKKDILRFRLSVEYALLQWLNHIPNGEVTFSHAKRFGKITCRLSVAGIEINPYQTEGVDDEFGDAELRSSMASLGLAAYYNYSKGKNNILFSPRRKSKGIAYKMLGAFATALLLGFLGNAFLPHDAGLLIANGVLAPIFDMFMGALSAVAGFMIFLSVICGICSMGDVATLNNIGKKILLRFIFFTFAVTSVSALLALFLFNVEMSASLGYGNFSDIYIMVIDIVPSNLIKPFVDGNFLQIIFIAVVFGTTIIALGEKVSGTVNGLEQANSIVGIVMGAIGALMPIFIFICILKMILTGVITSLGSALKVPLLFALVTISVIAVRLLYMAVKLKLSPKSVLQKLAPSFIIAISTGTSVAAFETMRDDCKNKHGVDEQIANFGLPLGISVFKPICAVGFIILAYFMVEFYAVAINAAWIMTAAITASFLAIAAPPVVGGGIMCYAILFSSLGIPYEAVAIAIALDFIMDGIYASGNVVLLQLELILASNSHA